MVRRMMGLLALAATGITLGFGVPSAGAQTSAPAAVSTSSDNGGSNYYAEDPGGYYDPTTTTVKATTTTTKATTTTEAPTTTVAAPTTVVAPTVPVSVENKVIEHAPQPTAVRRAMPAELAYTGSSTVLLIAIGAAAVALGLIARRAARH